MLRVLLFIYALTIASTSFTQNRTLGLLEYDEEVQDGYVLFSNNENTYLIDPCGLVVNTWQSEYKSLNGIYLLENGDLLRAATITGEFKAGGVGGIIERFSWDGTLLWHYKIADPSLHAHHDIAPMPNGNILVVAWEKISKEIASKKGYIHDFPIWNERIIELSPKGTDDADIVWQWSALDHVVQDRDGTKPGYGSINQNPQLLDINYMGDRVPEEENWLHINSIDYNAELDQIALSSRLMSEVYIIDHSTTTAEASGYKGGIYGKGGDILYRYGNPAAIGSKKAQSLFKQHDFRWIRTGEHQGHFMVFNNLYKDDQSSVDILSNPALDGIYTKQDLETDSLIRRYTMPGFFSDITSNAEYMPNGNLFILEGRQGIMTEIDMNDQLVWKYVNPTNRAGSVGVQGNEARRNVLFRVKKYPASYIAFEDKELVGTEPVELNPLPSLCELTWTNEEDKTQLKQTVVTSEYILLPSNSEYTLTDLWGSILSPPKEDQRLNIQALASGFYFLKTKTDDGLLSITRFYKL